MDNLDHDRLEQIRADRDQAFEEYLRHKRLAKTADERYRRLDKLQLDLISNASEVEV